MTLPSIKARLTGGYRVGKSDDQALAQALADIRWLVGEVKRLIEEGSSWRRVAELLTAERDTLRQRVKELEGK